MSLPRRLLKELDQTHAPELRENGIYYLINEANARKGLALIFGPENSVYAHCPLLFQVEFPGEYPHVSPKVKILTSDGVTRFHPNLYIDGKVCMSILGTWTGPEWIASMTISTVLISIQSLLDDNPITNEPGFDKYTLANSKAKDYADFVQMRIVSRTFRMLCQWKEGNMPNEWLGFEDIIEERGQKSYDALLALIKEKAVGDEVSYKNLVYSMSGETCWKALASHADKIGQQATL